MFLSGQPKGFCNLFHQEQVLGFQHLCHLRVHGFMQLLLSRSQLQCPLPPKFNFFKTMHRELHWALHHEVLSSCWVYHHPTKRPPFWKKVKFQLWFFTPLNPANHPPHLQNVTFRANHHPRIQQLNEGTSRPRYLGSQTMKGIGLPNNLTNKWVFAKIGGPQNRRFIMEILIKMDDLGVPPFSEQPLWTDTFVKMRTVVVIWVILCSSSSGFSPIVSREMGELVSYRVCYMYFLQSPGSKSIFQSMSPWS